MVGILADKDRIFLNIYGLPRLGPGGREGARRAGTAPSDMRRPDAGVDLRPDQGLGPARPRRRGLRHRA